VSAETKTNRDALTQEMSTLVRAVLALVILALVAPAPSSGQTVRIRSARHIEFPGTVDSNSPIYWADGTQFTYNSFENPVRSEGAGGTAFPRAKPVFIEGADRDFRWIEAALYSDGRVFAWYHAETPVSCPEHNLAYPSIGAMVSGDGVHFSNLGIVLSAPDEPDCSAGNIYFAGGHGDFSVVPDRDQQYVYFFYTNYGGPVEQQGIAVARMKFDDRLAPAGRVWKFRAGEWNEPGLGGVADPVFPAQRSWMSQQPLSYWGASVHFNTALGQYVLLMSEAIDAQWNQGGPFISFAADITNPTTWTAPQALPWIGGWYPQVVGSGQGESDSLAGSKARLFMMGRSSWEMIFEPGPLQIVDETGATADSPSGSSSAAGSTSASPPRIRRRG
jgi:hypothetical protein